MKKQFQKTKKEFQEQPFFLRLVYWLVFFVLVVNVFLSIFPIAIVDESYHNAQGIDAHFQDAGYYNIKFSNKEGGYPHVNLYTGLPFKEMKAMVEGAYVYNDVRSFDVTSNKILGIGLIPPHNEMYKPCWTNEDFEAFQKVEYRSAAIDFIKNLRREDCYDYRLSGK